MKRLEVAAQPALPVCATKAMCPWLYERSRTTHRHNTFLSRAFWQGVLVGGIASRRLMFAAALHTLRQ